MAAKDSFAKGKPNMDNDILFESVEEQFKYDPDKTGRDTDLEMSKK